jgi:hypothetical protein
MRTFIIFILFFGTNIVYSQQVTYPYQNDSTTVKISKIKGKGKVFDKNYIPNFIELPNYHSGITLNQEELIKVENIISRNFKKKYKKYWRQYLGYLNEKGEKYVFVHLEKFDRNTSENVYEYWKNTVTIVNTGWEENVTADYIINLQNAHLESYYYWLKKFR